MSGSESSVFRSFWWNRVNIPAWFVLFLLVGIVFAPALGRARFFMSDDVFLFSPNNIYTLPFVRGWLELAGNVQVREFLPVGWTFLFFEIRMFGFDPGLIQFVSILLHLFAAIFLQKIVQELSGSKWFGVCVAALYAVHPVNAEPVLVVSCQFWQLSTIFGFISTLYFIKAFSESGVHKGFYIFSILAFSCALLSKSGIVWLPVLFFSICLVFYRTSILDALVKAGPFFVLSFLKASVLFFVSFQSFPVPAYAGDSVFVSFISHLPYWLQTIRHWLFPLTWGDQGPAVVLSYIYPFSLADSFSVASAHVLSFLLALLILIAFWFAAGRSRLATLAVIWFSVNQAFFSGLFPGQWWPMADRYSYFGGAGFILLGCLVCRRAQDWANKYASGFFFKAVIVLGIWFYAELAGLQTRIWLNQSTATDIHRNSLKEDPLKYNQEIQRSIEHAMRNLQVHPLKSSLVNWKFGYDPEFEFVVKYVRYPASRYIRVQKNYYQGLVLAAINERRSGKKDGPLATQFEGLLAGYGSNPFIALYGALFYCSLGQCQKAEGFLETWKSSRRSNFNEFRARIPEMNANESIDFVRSFLAQGNFHERLEVINNYWLFYELYYRYLQEVDQEAEAKIIREMYSKVFPEIFSLKNEQTIP